MPRKQKISGMKVMKSMCASCPFGPNGDAQTAQNVIERTVVHMSASQICHHPRLYGKKETHLCRGARDIQLKVLVAIGALAEPTDAAFTAASKKAGVV